MSDHDSPKVKNVSLISVYDNSGVLLMCRLALSGREAVISRHVLGAGGAREWVWRRSVEVEANSSSLVTESAVEEESD